MNLQTESESKTTCGCGAFDAIKRRNPWILDFITLPSGYVPVVRTELRFSDRLGSWKARWSINRMKYWVAPGLYAVGNPSGDSPVFVTANYKMSFDILRSNLKGIDGWILVLDTGGINVWCAAGKGTFGTGELIRRIQDVKLGEVVSHRTLILPQLGAPGVSAHEVRWQSGFTVVYGPIRAEDIGKFLENGAQADAAMRTVTFTLYERTALIPVELVASMHYALFAVLAFFVLSGFDGLSFATGRLVVEGLRNALVAFGVWLTGVAAVPVLLPWLPFRTFSLKGIFAAFLYIATLVMTGQLPLYSLHEILVAATWLLTAAGVSGFLAINFTGATPLTSLSGVRKEVKRFLPVEIASMSTGFLFWTILRFV